MEEEKLRQVAESIDKIIAELAVNETGEKKQVMTFSESSQGIHIPSSVRGEKYNIEIYPTFIKITNQDISIVRDFHTRINPWSPEKMNQTGYLPESEIEWRNSQRKPLSIQSGESDIEIRSLELYDGEKENNQVFINEVNKSE